MKYRLEKFRIKSNRKRKCW